jgi:hypothetical protein
MSGQERKQTILEILRNMRGIDPLKNLTVMQHSMFFVGIQPFESEMNDDHLSRDPEYSWNVYIQS